MLAGLARWCRSHNVTSVFELVAGVQMTRQREKNETAVPVPEDFVPEGPVSQSPVSQSPVLQSPVLQSPVPESQVPEQHAPASRMRLPPPPPERRPPESQPEGPDS